MQKGGHPARRTMITCLVITIVALGCAPDRQTGVEDDSPDEAQAADDPGADGQPWEEACDRVLEPIGGDRRQLQDMDALEGLDALAQMSRVHSALSLPQMVDQLERLDQIVILAPLDDGVPTDVADGEAEDDQAAAQEDDAEQAPPESFVGPVGALLLDELLEVGEVEVADGGVVTVDREDDRVVVERGNSQVEVVCADLQVRDGVIHVLSGEPYDVGGDESQQPDTDMADRRDLPPDIDEQFDELDDSNGGGPTADS